MAGSVFDYLILVSLLGLVLIALYFVVYFRRAKRESTNVLGSESINIFGKNLDALLQRSYNAAIRIPVLSYFILKIRRRIEALAVYDEYQLRRSVIKIVYYVAMLFIIALMVIVLIRPSAIILFWILVGLMFISNLMVDLFVYRIEDRLLENLKTFNDKIRFFYHSRNVIEDSVHEAMKVIKSEMKIHAEKIYNILVSSDPEKELRRYEEVAPIKYLKITAGLALQVKMHGDKQTEDGSTFLRAISSVNEELNDEILYRSKLAYRLRFLGVVTIIPIFSTLPAKNWSISKFVIMESFYESRVGFFAELLSYIVAIVCFLIIRKLQEVSESKLSSKVRTVRWEESLFRKVPPVRKFIKALTPSDYSKGRYKIDRLIKGSDSPHTAEEVVLHRVLIGISVTILITIGAVLSHSKEAHSVMNNNPSVGMFSGTPTQEDIDAANRITEFDKQFVIRMQESGEDSKEFVKAQLAAAMGQHQNSLEVIAAYDRVMHKYNTLQNAYFKWTELIVILVIAYATSFMPIWNMKLKEKYRKARMENEVHQMLILISSLKDFDNMSVHIILDWMERFSDAFKAPLQLAIQNFDSGQAKALEELNKNVSFEPFTNIVDRLILSIERISLKQAFDDIEMERKFYIEKRKESQYRSLLTKGEMGQIIGFTPTVFTIVVYLVLPMLYVAAMKSKDVMRFLQ